VKQLSPDNVLVLMPAFNEERSIASVIAELLNHGYQVLVVDDGSQDRTREVARTAGARVLPLPINLGVGGALRAGFKLASREGFEAVVQVDADGQHPVEEIADLIDAANGSDAHMVIGSRFVSEATTMSVGLLRRNVMRVLAASASRATGVLVTDATSGFRLIRRPLLGRYAAQFPTNYLGDTYEALVSAGRAGFRVIEIPAGLKPRAVGQSSASVAQSVKFTLKGIGVAALRIHTRLEGPRG
jgi:glycosyltransferase involved in cell wall biosynthesis